MVKSFFNSFYLLFTFVRKAFLKIVKDSIASIAYDII